WHDFRGGEDGWTRYTRRRKWCRDAELVEVTSEERTADATDELKKPGATPPSTNNENKDGDSSEKGLASEAKHDDKGRSMDSTNAAQGGEESRNRRSSFSSAFSAAKSKVHDKHEKHVSDIKNLREKASQSKTNLLHGHGLSTKNENSAPNEHEPPPRHSVSSRADFEASKKKNGAKARKTHHPRPSKHNNRAEPLSTVKVNNWGQNADRNSSSSARSLRAREIATERDVPDRWGPHAGGPIAGPQRAQTQWGLSDDAEMGLS
ncbi:peroxisome- protein, partial [Ascosphaera atra]